MNDPWFDAFRFTMHHGDQENCPPALAGVERKIHFDARSNGQRRRHEREQERERNDSLS